MPWEERALQFLRAERARKLDTIEVFSSGKCRMQEHCDGEPVDITAGTMASLAE